MCFIATRQKTTFWDWNSNCFTACSDVNACLAINAWTCPQSRRHCIDGRCRCTAAWHRFYSVVSSYDAWFSVYIRKSSNSFVKYSYILFACFVSTLSEENKYKERINCPLFCLFVWKLFVIVSIFLWIYKWYIDILYFLTSRLSSYTCIVFWCRLKQILKVTFSLVWNNHMILWIYQY